MREFKFISYQFPVSEALKKSVESLICKLCEKGVSEQGLSKEESELLGKIIPATLMTYLGNDAEIARGRW